MHSQLQAVPQPLPWPSLVMAARQCFGFWGQHDFPSDKPRPWRENDAAMLLDDTGMGVLLGNDLEIVIIAPTRDALRQCWDFHIDRSLSDDEIADIGFGWVIFAEQLELARDILREGLTGDEARASFDAREAA